MIIRQNKTLAVTRNLPGSLPLALLIAVLAGCGGGSAPDTSTDSTNPSLGAAGSDSSSGSSDSSGSSTSVADLAANPVVVVPGSSPSSDQTTDQNDNNNAGSTEDSDGGNNDSGGGSSNSGGDNNGDNSSSAGNNTGNTDDSAPEIGAAQSFTAHTQLDDVAAHRFLTRSTFGATLDGVEKLKAQTPVDWVTEQMQMPATHMATRLEQENFRWAQYVNVWWKTAIQADDQLRQRVAFALSEIFVISGKDSLGDEQDGIADYYDILVDHAFGNFRDLMQAVTLSPIMGEYLSMKGNRKPDKENNIRPDENYARELLQLFTIGLVKLNADGSVQLDADGIPVPTYDQDVIEAFAHVFTGWHFANIDDFRWPTTKDYITPMQAYEDYHDKGEKILLDGFKVPAGQTAREDLEMTLDHVFNHPNVGPFIVKQLIQRLVTSNPSSQYVRDIVGVFNDNGVGVRGSLGSVVSAILLHEEAFNGYALYPKTFGKLKEPVMRITSLWRAFMPDNIHYDFNYAWAGSEISQAPLNANSVFNFFTPFFSQPGMIRDEGLVSPEFEIHDETSIINVTNRLLANSVWAHNYKYDSTPQRIILNIDREVELADDPDALLNHLNRVLLGGTMSEALRAEARTIMEARDYGWATSQKVVEAIFLIISSPESAVQL